MPAYIGRFAPSPTGALHAGSLVAALASWLDAKAHGGKWLVRIEDVDTPRCIPGADQEILRQLAACGLMPDDKPIYQSKRGARYQTALDQLISAQAAYPCACSRKDIELALAASGTAKPRHGELIYPGTCRHGLQGKEARAWRFSTGFLRQKRRIAGVESVQAAHFFIATDGCTVQWQDRRLSTQEQNTEAEVGDFVLKRADGLWAYQLAVVVDDAAQGITHVVRGEDLADNTARQILLQQALGYSTPQYLHTPLLLAPDGHKLSKQNGAQALMLETDAQIVDALNLAGNYLGMTSCPACAPNECLMRLVATWKTGIDRGCRSQ
ncbi:MAG: tRNA glutamyl-Q(34) synthetase GluQRS [Burkholderiales bacterium]|nr:MAG: tRNA glutamyl-Q(34) synthetase GluQRS [Burkholderiales bacterium]